MCAKNEFSADLLQKLPSRISAGSPVYCKPLGQQKKSKDSFPHAPGVCANGIFILAMYFGADDIHLTDKISLYHIYWLVFICCDIDYFLPSKISISNYTGKIKLPSAQKPGACWNESLRFFCYPKHLQ